jgi:hypothetical protein
MKWSEVLESFKQKDERIAELTELLQMCSDDMYTGTGIIRKKTAIKLMTAQRAGLINAPE